MPARNQMPEARHNIVKDNRRDTNALEAAVGSLANHALLALPIAPYMGPHWWKVVEVGPARQEDRHSPPSLAVAPTVQHEGTMG